MLVPISHLLSQCLVLGAGPCGLRTAIELSLLGAQVVVLEKREAFSRNNVLHLWPFSISDLRGLGAKTFYGKFCTGSLDHISEWLSVRAVPTPLVFLPLSVHSLRFYPHAKRSIVGKQKDLSFIHSLLLLTKLNFAVIHLHKASLSFPK